MRGTARGGDGLWRWLAAAWLGLAETPGMERRGAHLQLPRVMEVLNPWVLNIFAGGDSTASLGIPCQRLINPTAEKVFSRVQMQFPVFSFVPVVPSVDTTERARFPLCCTLPFTYPSASLKTPPPTPGSPPG